MRVITGSARGRKLETLSGDDVRPTTDKVKEAVFSAIQFDIEGRSFLDLFAGSGQMGIEALSRGAKSATFVDKSRKSVDIVRKNLNNAGFYEKAKVFHNDSLSFIDSTAELYDIVYLDPPFGSGLLQKALPKIAEKMKKTGVIIAENEENEEILQKYGEFVLDRQKHYGKIKVTMYRHKDFVL
ncbi:MAG: 16S rRNA (guanine(966)-N(2))-methyltransferase RsmD [Ruminococcus sp.]|nr:16S rRNA (guanine(966)-N(2))-methyltransferase RsmD [Ruminococcus sp.]